MKASSFAVLVFSGTAMAPLAHAHGSLETPVSRIYNCYQEGAENPKSTACKAAQSAGGTQAFYDWSGVRQGEANDNHRQVVPDGQLCSGGGNLFRGFDLVRGDWPKTSIVPTVSGDYTFVWKAPARHATSYFRYYITKDGWNPNLPLKWSDLSEFAQVTGSAAQQSGDQYRMTVKLPKGLTGPRIIYGVWQRADSKEAFYACADVIFPGDGAAVPDLGWNDQGSLIANSDLPANTTITLRVFDPQGRDAGKYAVTLNATTGRASQWPFTLAQKVNAESGVFKIGVLQSQARTATIVPIGSATANHVYLSRAYAGYTYEIDKDTPSGGANEWREGATYSAGQAVAYQGRNYRCLQSHTAWAGAGWTPDVSPTLWQPL
jgi:chitin-binding protein